MQVIKLLWKQKIIKKCLKFEDTQYTGLWTGPLVVGYFVNIFTSDGGLKKKPVKKRCRPLLLLFSGHRELETGLYHCSFNH